MTYAHRPNILDADSHLMEGLDWMRDQADAKTRDLLPDLTAALEQGRRRRWQGDPTRRGAHQRCRQDRRARGERHRLGQGLAGARRHGQRRAVAGARPARLRVAARVLDVLGRTVRLLRQPRRRLRRRQRPQPDDDRLLRRRRPTGQRRLPPAERPGAVAGVARPKRSTSAAAPSGSPTPPRRAARRPTSTTTPCGPRCRRPGCRSCCTSAAARTRSPRRGTTTAAPARSTSTAAARTCAAKDLPSVHHAAETFLSAMVLDGVFERFPELRCGVIEMGASWAPSLLEPARLRRQELRSHRADARRADPQAVRLHPPPGALHPVPGRGRGRDGGHLRTRAVPVLQRLPAPGGHQGPDRQVRAFVRRARHRRSRSPAASTRTTSAP